MASSSSRLEKLTSATASITVRGTSRAETGWVSGVRVVWDIPVRVTSGFQDDKRYGLLRCVTQRQVRLFAAEENGKLGQLPAEPKTWPASGLTDHFNIAPAHTAPPACTYGLHSGLFGGKAGSQTLGRIRLGSTVTDLFRGKDTGQEALSKALHGGPDSGDLSYVNSCTYNHLALIKVP